MYFVCFDIIKLISTHFNSISMSTHIHLFFFFFFIFLSSHLPTHRITVYPMVTIRISDRHRLIQPYIHNYSWLLFAALTLYTSELSSEKTMDGVALDSSTLRQASALQTCCSQLITDCLLKGQTGKGNRFDGPLGQTRE